MDLMIRRNIRQIESDVQKIHMCLNILKRDHKAWAREREEHDLEEVIENLKRLESDVSMAQADCICTGHGYLEDGAWQVLYSLRRVFAMLSILFNDLKKVRTELKEAYIDPADLKQLEIDWGRFRKIVGQMLTHVREGEDLMKVKDASCQSKGVENICFSIS
jgi:hypothetical protein